jgi:hypothetical protein
LFGTVFLNLIDSWPTGEREVEKEMQTWRTDCTYLLE